MWFLSWCTAGVEEDISQNELAIPLLQVIDGSAPTVQTLSQLWRPFLSQDKVKLHGAMAKPLFKETTLQNVDIEDLIATAKRIRKVETFQQGVFEIDSILLRKDAMEDLQKQFQLANLFQDQNVEIKARKLLVISSVNQELQNVPEPGTIGLVEVILDSAYTGGELQVMHDGEVTNVRAEPYDWVAVHADVSCIIRSVTSGYRVSLIYDVIPPPHVSAPLAAAGTYRTDCTFLLSDVSTLSYNLPELIGIAEHLRPELVGKRNMTVDACVLNSTNLHQLGSSVDLGKFFPSQMVTVQAKHLVIQRSEGENNTIADGTADHGEGYLGTLVLILRRAAGGDTICMCRGSETVTIYIHEHSQWYAYTADTTATNDPVVNGTHVALHYAIYTAGTIMPVHNPLPEVPYTLTRSVVPETLSSEVLGGLEMELASTDAVIITLQHLFPEGPTDQLWNTYPSYLQGGDRVLYDILTGTSSSEAYGVTLVWTTLHWRFDATLKKDVIVPEKSSFVPISGPQVTYAKCGGTVNIKVILCTKLTERHRALNYTDSNKVYTVYCLHVSKKMK